LSAHTPPYGSKRSSSRRFLPPDPSVQQPYRLTPGLAVRVGVLGAITLVVFGVLLFRLWSLQVLSGDQYLSVAQGNQLRTITVEAPRGSIVDRSGGAIVDNVPGTAVKLWVGDMPKKKRYAMVKRLATILDVPPARLAREVSARRNDPLTPITVKTAVHEEQVAYLMEHQAEFPGVTIAQTYLRHYTHQSLGAQILGYVGEISADELKRLRKKGYASGDKLGKSGVEAWADRYLRGTAGLAQIRVNALGQPQSDLELRRDARPGYSVQLTLDMKLQRAAENALRYGIALARSGGSYNANGGAIIALDPRDGAVLAMASNPTFKPSVYVGRVDPKKIAPLVNDEAAKAANYPGFNRATQGIYPPGSTFKPVTALAAMQEHLLQPYETIQCTPTARYGLDRQLFKNWDPYVNEPMTLATALAQSCDTYFYTVGNRFYNEGLEGRSRLQEWAHKFGFGESAGFDLGGESTGTVPDPAWRKRTYDNDIDRAWNPGDSIQLAIGQKDIAVTPLQMTRFYAMLANGGKLVTPYLVSGITQPGASAGESVAVRRFLPDPPTDVGLDGQAVQFVREGLYAATHAAKGTSSGVFSAYPVPIAGKTGTAEKVVQIEGYPAGHLEDQSWWCGWGPYDLSVTNGKAPIVVCALIENGGHGSSAAAPAALRVFEKWFGVKAPTPFVVSTD
jgi:penicillin-binding protein 2